MQAILVRYMPATNHRPSRFKASCAAKSVTVSMSYEGKDEDRAAKALLEAMSWTGERYDLVKGQLPNGDYVYTFAVSDRVSA